jgi:hypothetical protein
MISKVPNFHIAAFMVAVCHCFVSYSLVEIAEKVRKMGNLMEKSAYVASKKYIYIEAALSSATASMKFFLERNLFWQVSSILIHTYLMYMYPQI